MENNLLDNIVASADINSHIEFVEELFPKYEWEPTEMAKLSNAVKQIKIKQNDTNIYMAVVGEFSSGKSSFINAQIKDDLLKADVLQATTSAITIIKFGEKLDALAQYKNGSTVSYSQNIGLGKKIWRSFFKPKNSRLKNELREFINELTTEEEIAKNIDQVIITHNSSVLADGLVIIDTPGTNAINERHELVTVNAIREIADAAIITIPSNKPLSKSLLHFVREHLHDVISKCVFVVTKMDLIQIKEQKRVLDWVEQQLKTEFAADKIHVFPYTPWLILKDIIPDVEFSLSEEQITFLTEQSEQTEKQIIEVLKKQRLTIQMQKLIILIENLLGTLEHDLKLFEKTYKERHEALEKNIIKDLGGFVKNRKEVHQKAIIKGSYPITELLVSQLDTTHNELLENLHDNIFTAQNHKELNKIMKKTVELTVSSKLEELQEKLPETFNEFELLAQKQNNEFEQEFKRLYSELATLSGKISVNEQVLSCKTSDLLKNFTAEQLAAVNETVKSDKNRCAYASVGGGGAGALIGTAVLPGIGTVIGAVAGSFLGSLFKKPLDELKNQYYCSVEESIDDSFCKAQDSAQAIVDDIVNRITVDLFAIMDSYFEKYDLLVKEMINRDERERQELSRKREMITKDLHGLQNRRKVLENLHGKL